MADNVYNPTISEKDQRAFDIFRKFIIPVLGVGEAIATKGKSPGTTAFNAEQIFQSQEDRRRKMLQEEEDRASAAVDRALKERQAGIQEKIYNEQLSKSEQEREAEFAALERANKFRNSLNEIQNKSYAEQPDFEGPPSPEQQNAQENIRNEDIVNTLKQFVASEYPKEFFTQATQPDFYEKLAAQLGFQQSLKQPELNLKREEIDIKRQEKADKAAEAKAKAEADRSSAIGLVDDLLVDPNLASGLNPKRLLGFVEGTSEFTSGQKLKQLRNLVSLNGREKLKGSGAISDFESKMLASSQSILSQNLKKSDLDKELVRIRKVLNHEFKEPNKEKSSSSGSKFKIESVKQE